MVFMAKATKGEITKAETITLNKTELEKLIVARISEYEIKKTKAEEEKRKEEALKAVKKCYVCGRSIADIEKLQNQAGHFDLFTNKTHTPMGVLKLTGIVCQGVNVCTICRDIIFNSAVAMPKT